MMMILPPLLLLLILSLLIVASDAGGGGHWLNPEITPWELPWYHPPVEWIVDEKIGFSGHHPTLGENSTFQNWVLSHTSRVHHRFFDGSLERTYVKDPWPLTPTHPRLEEYFAYGEEPAEEYLEVFFGHPDLMGAYLGGKTIPGGHPEADALLRKILPSHHPDVDDLFQDQSTRALPAWHIDISGLVTSNPRKFSVFSSHPDLDDEYDMGDPVDAHPSVQRLFEPYLPDGHPDVDDLMRSGFALPRFHPDISSALEPRSLSTSPGALLSYAAAATVLLILLGRCLRKTTRRTTKIVPPSLTPVGSSDEDDAVGGGDGSARDSAEAAKRRKTPYSRSYPRAIISILGGDHGEDIDSVEVSFDEEGSIQSELKYHGAPPRLDQRRHRIAELNVRHRDENLGPPEKVRENILAYEEKESTALRSNWNKAFGSRIVASDVSMGEAVSCLVYIIVNLVALLASPTYSYDLGFGSLAAGNTLFLVMTATRNSVFTWLIGMTFDQALIYHRFIGRLAVAVSLVHSVMYYDRIIDQITVTGLIALDFGVIIFLTSLSYVRRKLFNVFFWSHFAFVGFIAAMYLHAPGARPFIWTSAVCYGADKLLGLIWTQLPRKTTKFEKVGGRTAHVRFHKTPLMNILGRYKVGQYVFVNFPELSLHEWHPFSVASAPKDSHVDLYIRALGDHTAKIVQFAEKCAAENKQALIRCDGPYGDLSFNYRRYGNLLLVSGGIGITPLVSVLKDIFEDDGSKGDQPHHCIRNVTLVWIMPRASEASIFLEMLNQFRLKSLENPLLPSLNLAIHITRAGEKCDDDQVVYSKPDFGSVMHRCIEDMSDDSKSILVYACGPGRMVNQLWDVSMKTPLKKNDKRIRVDFYHESFEF